MKLFISVYLLYLFFLCPEIGFSQKENSKVVEISGVKYVMHTVKKSETVFSLCQKYKITQAELRMANPGLTGILQTGATIKIPVGKIEVTAPQKVEVSRQSSSEEEYYYHKVGKKQTVFSIAKQYGISANDLIRYNPDLSKGLEIGQVLKIPISITNTKEQSVPESAVKPENQNFTKYKVEKGETLFSLASRFGVEVDELKKANPSLFSRSLEAGETILIPEHPERAIENSANKPVNTSVHPEKMEEQVFTKCQPISGKNIQKYKVGLLLPLYLPGNDQGVSGSVNKAVLMSKISLSNQVDSPASDTTIVINGINIDLRTASFLEFYEGVLLAVDSMQDKGMNIELDVFDVTNEQMVNSLLLLDEFRELNLIIGPVFTELQENVAAFAAKNHIPMISPLSQTGNFEQRNLYYFKVNPTREFQIEQTADYIADEFADKNFILLDVDETSSSPEAKLAQLSKAKLTAKPGKNRFHEYNIQEQGVNLIKPLLDGSEENVFIIPTDNEAQVSIAVTNLTALAENYNIVLMGTSLLTKLKSLQTENFHRTRLRYLSPYFVDYKKPLVRRFIGQYRELFSTEPSQFSFQGFDVSYYFLSALFRYGKDFRNCLPDYPMELTQMDFNFRKVAPMGGFMNRSLFVNSYERNFDILNLGVVSGN